MRLRINSSKNENGERKRGFLIRWIIYIRKRVPEILLCVIIIIVNVLLISAPVFVLLFLPKVILDVPIVYQSISAGIFLLIFFYSVNRFFKKYFKEEKNYSLVYMLLRYIHDLRWLYLGTDLLLISDLVIIGILHAFYFNLITGTKIPQMINVYPLWYIIPIITISLSLYLPRIITFSMPDTVAVATLKKYISFITNYLEKEEEFITTFDALDEAWKETFNIPYRVERAIYDFFYFHVIPVNTHFIDNFFLDLLSTYRIANKPTKNRIIELLKCLEHSLQNKKFIQILSTISSLKKIINELNLAESISSSAVSETISNQHSVLRNIAITVATAVITTIVVEAVKWSGSEIVSFIISPEKNKMLSQYVFFGLMMLHMGIFALLIFAIVYGILFFSLIYLFASFREFTS